eukprot:CAMPEP_0195522210 /NCGR_PEP_ID=MMETSP0794_2-20130614/20114_1 /TAXON_ID=515487 /ORGANISM="Stephanopyxis turris, Strain CCMP 815" /LENGTH=494 /DNA_ID=CAMNT_0040651905 /DNA_START=79 /DNA_END=1563 /DNA_ORIENTATION=-
MSTPFLGMIHLALLISSTAAWHVQTPTSRWNRGHTLLASTLTTPGTPPPEVLSVQEIYRNVFSEFATSPDFALSNWGREPLIKRNVDGVAGSFTLEDVRDAVDSDFLEAGLGVTDARGGWKMGPVFQPRGDSYRDSKLRYTDVAEAMTAGTVVFNSAGAQIPKLAAVCFSALEAFELPNCLNLYLTGRGLTLSAPPHTDKQDVFVLQTSGSKHWRVFEPPKPSARATADPLARGKGDDELSLSTELGEPLIDVRLDPGDVLYVPAGFPHTTDTVNENDDAGTEGFAERSDADSVHLTLGVDTHIWGLDLLSLLQSSLCKAKLPEMRTPTTLSASTYWHLMRVPQSLGFLAHHTPSPNRATLLSHQLGEAALLAEERRWKNLDKSQVAEKLDGEAVAEKMMEHANAIVDVQRELYMEAIMDDGRPTMRGRPRMTIMRVNPHMNRIEKIMEEYLSWFGGDGSKPLSAGTASTSGFGGGGGKKTTAKKVKGKKRKKK